jgi:lysozyme
VEDIMEANGLDDANYIYIGQELIIPGSSGDGGSSAVSAQTSTGAARQVYVVESSDTLYGIAGRFGTTADAIASLNTLADPNFLSIGQELLIP